jgi:hypothetical protein
MEDERKIVTGEKSRQSLIKKHHAHNLVAPSIPRHLVASLKGLEGDYSQLANFPWDPLVCYMLDYEIDRTPAAYIEHGMTTDYFGTGTRSNGYNDMGGIVACSGGIFISQQDVLSVWSSESNSYDDGLEPQSYNQSMESFNKYLAPIMDRPNIEPSVGIIYSKYREDFWLFSTIKESWGADFIHHSWLLPDGWGLVGKKLPDEYADWLNVIAVARFSEELTAAARYLRTIDPANVEFDSGS